MLSIPSATEDKTEIPRIDFVYNENKPNSQKTIVELWMDAQLHIKEHVQPPIIIENGYLLGNMNRKRAPTTWETLQNAIDTQTEVRKQNKQIETGDWTDDEEEDIDEINEQTQQNSTSPRLGSSKPGEFAFSATIDNSDNKKQLKNEDLSKTNDNSPNENSNEDNNISSKANEIPSTNSLASPKNKNLSINELWFFAQKELSEGIQPTILRNNNIRLSNIRQHVAKYIDHTKKNSPQSIPDVIFSNIMLTVPREQIPDDEDDEDTSQSWLDIKKHNDKHQTNNVGNHNGSDDENDDNDDNNDDD